MIPCLAPVCCSSLVVLSASKEASKTAQSTQRQLYLIIDDVPRLWHHLVVGVRKGVIAYSGGPKGVADDLGGLAHPLHGSADVIRCQRGQRATQGMASDKDLQKHANPLAVMTYL